VFTFDGVLGEQMNLISGVRKKYPFSYFQSRYFLAYKKWNASMVVCLFCFVLFFFASVPSHSGRKS
jgi:hypothetical protein